MKKYMVKHSGFGEIKMTEESFATEEEAKNREAVLVQNYEFCRCDRTSLENYVSSKDDEKEGLYFIKTSEYYEMTCNMPIIY